ncbi:MAG: GAF domain-containing protein, partial [Candidatus Sulfotelmatobacter sp.]
MVTTPTKPRIQEKSGVARGEEPTWREHEAPAFSAENEHEHAASRGELRRSGSDALQALLAFSAMHQQIRQRRALAQAKGFETVPAKSEFATEEQFVLDEVLQLVAERAIAITGADGLGIALAENNEIVLRASAGTVKPDVGARIQRDSAFSGACFRTAQIIRCDDTETDDRVNLSACRKLGARSIVAVPLCGRRRVIGLLEAFSTGPFGFNDSDVASLELLAELIVAALKPEDEDRFAQAAQVAEEKLRPVVAAGDPPFPAPAQPVSETGKRPEVISDREAEPSSVPEPAPATSRHPGIRLVLLLVLLATLLGGGLWWTLKRAPLQPVTESSAESSAKPGAPQQRSAISLTTGSTQPDASSSPFLAQSPSAQSSSGTSSDTQANSGGDSDLATEMQAPASQEGKTEAESAKPTRVTGIRHWSSADSSTVVLD